MIIQELEHAFANCWRHFPDLSRKARHTRTVTALKTFEAVYLEWRQHRGLGCHGILRYTHALNVSWENSLVSVGMGCYHPDVLQQLGCYRNCDIFCRNNQKVVPILERMMELYCSLPNHWEVDFRARIGPVSPYFGPMGL